MGPQPWPLPTASALALCWIGTVCGRRDIYVTKNNLVVMASEVGVLDIPADEVLYKGRLQPGKLFLVDTEQGRIVDDGELKASISRQKPYREWVETNKIDFASLPEPKNVPQSDPTRSCCRRQQLFGYTVEDLRILMAPMAKDGEEAIGSMGTDTPLAVLSNQSQLLYNYFKQLFAQVTNPPIDSIREEMVMSVESYIGS